jgi:MauM/NapG family ferredoxin protein
MRDAGQRREQDKRRTMGRAFTGRTKYYILAFVAVLAALGGNIAGWLDPLCILMRGVAFALFPSGEWLAAHGAESVGGAGAAGAWMHGALASPTPQAYAQAALHLGILLGILLLSRIRRRYWCHVLCPLGAFYGLLARCALWKRRVNSAGCTECSACGLTCRMEAVEPGTAAAGDPSECVRCMECGDVCPQSGISFGFGGEGVPARAQGIDLSRRALLGSAVASVVALPLLKLKAPGDLEGAERALPFHSDESFLRPPGARTEDEFLRLCIRCGACFKVCPQNAIHPALLEMGPEALWTPRVMPRLGWCDPACVLCSNNCPTTALQPLGPAMKRLRGRIGTAVVGRGRCIPWRDGRECGVCEEVCPITPKVITLKASMVRTAGGGAVSTKVPLVDTDRCTGCGACENKCPVDGASAIRVERKRESRAKA